MTDEIVHLAGPTVSFESLVRQRCAWCGGLIEEWDLERVAVQEDTRPPEWRGLPLDPDELPHWSGLVAVDGRTKWAVAETKDHQAPLRSCMRLLP